MTFTRVAMVLLLLLALTGATISYALLTRTNSPAAADNWVSRACSGSVPYACDRVLQSRYASMLKQPTALWGLMFFTFLGTWYLAVGRPNHPARYWHIAPVAVNLLGAVFATYFTYVMVSKLRTVCPLCFVTHMINWLMLLLGLSLWPRREKSIDQPAEGEQPPQLPAKPNWRLALVGLALSVVLPLAFRMWYARDHWVRQVRMFRNAYVKLNTDPEMIKLRFDRQPVQQLNIRPDDPVRGPADAAHTVVVFSDFQCPRCKAFSDVFRLHMQAVDEPNVRIVFKHYPLSPACNASMKQNIHAFACDAARAAEAARRIGGNEAFWRMHDQLFAQQETIERGGYAELARAANIDPDALLASMKDAQVTNWIAGDILQAGIVGVRSTPTVFLNGRLVEHWDSQKFWETALKTTPLTTQSASEIAKDR